MKGKIGKGWVDEFKTDDNLDLTKEIVLERTKKCKI
jgi:hypothetical protein